MDGSSVVQWLAIGLAFLAVAVILRYARQPRCEVCARRHARADAGAGVAEVSFADLEAPEPAERSAISWKAE